MFTVLLYGTSLKSVTIVVDGKPTVVETRQSTLQRLLDEQAIKLGEHDQLSAKLDDSLKHGDKIEIVRSKAITVTVKGKSTELHTTKSTVGEALKAASIKMDGDDKLVPASNTKVKSGLKVKVINVSTMVVETKKTLPFDTVEQKDSSLAKGKKKTVTQGRNGEIVKKILKTFEDGIMVNMKLVDEKVVATKQNEVIAIGTRKPVQVLSVRKKVAPKAAVSSKSSANQALKRAGVDFQYKKVLHNVTLTAYSADFASTGKSKGHKYYGITASGARVKEGQTIAVDTSVIPMGYWVYIEGVGFRRAEDRGSAIRGNKIDVYLPTQYSAMQFGRKKGRTVYVIGPNKP
jgi:uncharacterized protein YabE (DUF348 family)/3D (Asp-Asp-Asp) domain-containing protein